MRPRLGDIIRAFGVEPEAIRLIYRRQNAHWRVRAGRDLFALRRADAWLDVEGDLAWELGVVAQWAATGLPVPQPIAPPREFDGSMWFLMPWMPGRPIGRRPWNDADTDYERVGVVLAEVHAATASLPPPPQRPGWGSYCDAAAPVAGGIERRQLLAELAKVDADVAKRFARAAEALEERDLPGVFARHPRRTIHADVAPWNIRLRNGRLSGLFDFELAHVDVPASDVAQSRRGSHDAVVRGYLKHASLTDAELANLDAFWLASVLANVWRELARRLTLGPITEVGFEWTLAHLDLIRPYQGR